MFNLQDLIIKKTKKGDICKLDKMDKMDVTQKTEVQISLLMNVI